MAIEQIINEDGKLTKAAGDMAGMPVAEARQKVVKILKKNMKKVALITGITGQDGSYLAEFLIDKGYIDDHKSPMLMLGFR